MREVQLANRWAQELETVVGGPRRTGWPLAEAAGEATPHGMPPLVASAAWDVAAVRDDLRA